MKKIILALLLILSIKIYSQPPQVFFYQNPFTNHFLLIQQDSVYNVTPLMDYYNGNCEFYFNKYEISTLKSSNIGSSISSVVCADTGGLLKNVNLATVAFSNNYSDLSGKPTIPTNTNQLTNGSGFVTHDSQTLSISSNTLTLSGGNSISLPIYTSTDYANSASISGGVGQAIFYLTSDKTSSGTALYSTIDYVSPIINDATANYTYQWSYNSSTKVLTVTSKTNLSTNVLTNLLGGTIPSLQPPSNVANGITVYLLVKGH